MLKRVDVIGKSSTESRKCGDYRVLNTFYTFIISIDIYDNCIKGNYIQLFKSKDLD